VLVVGGGASGAQIADELCPCRTPPCFSPSASTPACHGAIAATIWSGGSRRSGCLTCSRSNAGRSGCIRRSPAPMAAEPSISATSPPKASRCSGALRPRATACSTSQPGLAETLAQGDLYYSVFLDMMDEYVRKCGLDLPEDRAAVPSGRTRLASPSRSGARSSPRKHQRRDLVDRLWRRFRLDRHSHVRRRRRTAPRGGVSEVPGLYFLGLSWLSRLKSAFLSGVGDDAADLADHIASRR